MRRGELQPIPVIPADLRPIHQELDVALKVVDNMDIRRQREVLRKIISQVEEMERKRTISEADAAAIRQKVFDKVETWIKGVIKHITSPDEGREIIRLMSICNEKRLIPNDMYKAYKNTILGMNVQFRIRS